MSAPALAGPEVTPLVSTDWLAQHLGDADLAILDVRDTGTFAAGHIPGTINIPLSKSFLNWMGALVPEDRDFFLIAGDAKQAVLRVALPVPVG